MRRWLQSLWNLAWPQSYPKPPQASASFLSHWKDGKFFNPWPTWAWPTVSNLMSGASEINMSQFGRPNAAKIREAPYSQYLNLDGSSPSQLRELRDPVQEGTLQMYWVGHACVLVRMAGGLTFITDPVFAQRASPLSFAGPKRFVPPACRPEDLPELDFILLSHNHYDHLDLSFVRHMQNRVPWLVPLGLKSWFQDQGVTNVREFDWWQEETIRKGDRQWTVACTPAQHWSKRGLFDSDATLWGSWCVLGERQRFFFGGDTGMCPVFKEIGERYGPFDLAAIPIGAYAPRSFLRAQHVNVEEACQIHTDIGSKHSLGIHWGTFSLSSEPYLEPAQTLEKLRTGNGWNEEEFFVVRQGEPRLIPTT